jgi:hypothetical protein
MFFQAITPEPGESNENNDCAESVNASAVIDVREGANDGSGLLAS